MDERLNAEDAAEYCEAGMLTDFSHVADDVTSAAAIIGPSRARFEGRDQTCTDVEAHYRVVKELMVPPGMILKLGRVTRRMCIDRRRNLILRDRFEADTDAGPDRYHIVQTVTYDRIDRNPPLSAALFVSDSFALSPQSSPLGSSGEYHLPPIEATEVRIRRDGDDDIVALTPRVVVTFPHLDRYPKAE